MATNNVKGVNVTKYDAGGSGDNYISDGYIKTVEKVWLDSYTLTTNITLTNTTILIAKVPDNKKITSIDIMVETGASQTSGTISIGHLGDVDAFSPAEDISHNLTLSTLSFPSGGALGGATTTLQNEMKIDGLQMVTSGTTGDIVVRLNNWTMTTGTLKSVVRYT